MKESVSGQTIRFDTRQLEAILFDLDGVITRTSWVHAAAWKKLFDAYLHKRARQTGEGFSPLTSRLTIGDTSMVSRGMMG